VTTSTHTTRRLVTVAAVIGAITLLVPVAQAQQSPDVVMRAVNARTAQVDSPDVIMRAVNAQQNDKLAAIDARERALTERPGAASAPGPDALERALNTHSNALTATTTAMLDARERSLASRPVGFVQQPVVEPSFDWSDFGAGAGVGSALALLVGAGVLGIRRNQSRVTTA
jgi:hypothetical protein